MTGAFHVITDLSASIALTVTAIAVLRQQWSRNAAFLSAALLVTALLELLDLFALTGFASPVPWKSYSLYAEALLPPLWLLCSVTYARWEGPDKTGRLMKGVIALSSLFVFIPLLVPANLIYYAPDFPDEKLIFLATPGMFYYILLMTSLVLALINIEATLTNASPDALSKIKLEAFGIVTIIAVLVIFFSQALLYRSINMEYTLLRSMVIIAATGFMLFSALRKSGKAQIYVAPNIAVKSLALVAVAAYLVILGVLGEGMKHLKYFMPRQVVIGIAFAIAIGLVMLLLSEKVRREIKVRLHKSFYQNKHDYRTQWLLFTERLASRSGKELVQTILSAYCDIFGIQGASLFLYDEGCNGYTPISFYRMPPITTVIPQDNLLISYIRNRAWVFSMRDDNPEILSQNGRFLLGNLISFVVPLFGNDRLEGFIALGPVINKNELFIYEDYDLMKTIARQASVAILNQRLSERLTQARQMEAIGNVSTFIAHDLKNLASTITLITDNAKSYMNNPDFQKDMLDSLSNTAAKMQLLIGRLKNMGEKQQLELQETDLMELAAETVRMISSDNVILSGYPVRSFVDIEAIRNVILNLIINAIEASPENSPINVEVGILDMPFVRITDHGCGMSADFIRNGLFTPFQSTKKQGLGIGLYQCREIIKEHGGKIEVWSVAGEGSSFTVRLPGRKDNGVDN